jgi:hypothetical protein
MELLGRGKIFGTMLRLKTEPPQLQVDRVGGKVLAETTIQGACVGLAKDFVSRSTRETVGGRPECSKWPAGARELAKISLTLIIKENISARSGLSQNSIGIEY